MSKKANTKALGLMAGAVLVLGGGATYYQYNAVSAAKAKVAALESEVPSQKELEEELAASSTKLDEFQTQIRHLEGGVPDVAYVPTLLKELENVGLAHGIKVTGVRPAPQTMMPGAPQEGQIREKKKEYEEIEIEVKGRGRYDDIKAFLDALQGFPKVLAVKTVSLSPDRQNDGPAGMIEATVNVTAFVFPFEFISNSATNVTAKHSGTAAKPSASPVQSEAGVQHEQSGGSASSLATETMTLSTGGN